MGRINFGRAIKDFKGITDRVTLTADKDGHKWVCDLKNWQVFNIEDAYDTYAAMSFRPLAGVEKSGDRLPMGVYRATFNVRKPSDTFLNFETWGKGLVYVNGHPMGRIWEIGPQQTLYMPGCWLNKGENEILVFDILGPREARSEGLKEPKLDQLLVQKPLTHRTEGQKLDLSGEKPVVAGSFKPGNGWQEVRFASPARCAVSACCGHRPRFRPHTVGLPLSAAYGGRSSRSYQKLPYLRERISFQTVAHYDMKLTSYKICFCY